MKQIDFEEANNSLVGKGREPVSAFVDDKVGLVITCWKPSLSERLKLLFSGRVFVCMMSSRKNVPATRISFNKGEVFGQE